MTLAGLGGDAAATPIGATTVDVDTAVAAAGGTITTGKVDHGAVIVVGSNGAKFVFGGAAGGANAMVDVIGLSTDEGNLESLPAGASKSFRITITGVSAGSSLGAVLDILRTVPAGSELFITMAGTDGQTSTISACGRPRSRRGRLFHFFRRGRQGRPRHMSGTEGAPAPP